MVRIRRRKEIWDHGKLDGSHGKKNLDAGHTSRTPRIQEGIIGKRVKERKHRRASSRDVTHS